MPWFYCDDCGESIKKPKVAAHISRCSTNSFTCIDCSTTFDRKTVHGHTKCVTETEKYVHGATKPGGFASNGFLPERKTVVEDQEPVGIVYLSTRAPWMCKACDRTYMNEKAMFAHTVGRKHRQKVKRMNGEVVTTKAPKEADDVINGVKSILTEGDTKKLKKKKLQRRLALEILSGSQKELTLKRFHKRFVRKCILHGIGKEMQLQPVELAKKMTDVEIDGSSIRLRR